MSLNSLNGSNPGKSSGILTEPYLDYKSVESMYGDEDLGSCSLFAGNLINFGFYDKLDLSTIMTHEERIESEINLYRRVVSELDITSQDKVLEVGCGVGGGGQIIIDEYCPKELVGLDLSSEQIARAKKVNAQFLESHPNYTLQIGNAQSMPFEDNAFEKIYSVEAIQHFPDYREFLKDSYRVLKPQGRLSFASFFATNRESLNELIPRIDTFRKGIDFIVPIEEVKASLSQMGFKNIRSDSIGKHVWEGFDHWIKQTEYKGTWDENWLKSYKDKLVDYYVVTASK